jgi:hypothetical protein
VGLLFYGELEFNEKKDVPLQGTIISTILSP